MAFLTSFNSSNEIIIGEYIDILPSCLSCIKNRFCAGFYDNLFQSKERKSGFYTCPKGYAVYVSYLSDTRIFPCLRCKEYYQRKKKSSSANICYNPILNSSKLLQLINHDLKENKIQKEIIEMNDKFRFISHELKSLNAQIKQQCESIFCLDDNTVPSNLLAKIRDIMCCSTMIAGRFIMYDFEKAPKSFLQSSSFSCNIYKKFDKIKMLLSNYMHKHIKINLIGNTYKCFTAYSSFEFIPFLILENAIKYSPDKESINVEFTDNSNQLLVKISSLGPFCSSDDLSHIFEKGYRGIYAREAQSGGGLGLYFVKQIANLHEIQFTVHVPDTPSTRIEGIPYSEFSILLFFSNVFDEVTNV